MTEIKEIRNLMIPMRDGVLLACNLYRPDNDEPYPAIVMRTPYLKEKFSGEWLYSNYKELALAGYNVVIQDVRGTGKSEGVLLSSGGNEVDDGYDTIEWIAAQNWCDGSVGMYGLSYFGFTQMAAAENNPPHLKAICPFQNSSLHPFSITKFMTFGNFHLMWIYGRVLDFLETSSTPDEEKERIRNQIKHNQENWDEIMFRLPVRETEAAKIEGVPLLHDFIDLVDGVEDDAYWKQARRPINIKNIQAPMFFLTGWFDGARDGTFDNYNEVMENGTDTAKKKSRLVVGPWLHGGALDALIDGTDFGDENSGKGQRVDAMMLQWFGRWLKNKPAEDYPPVYIFVLGENKWRAEQEWPLARTEYIKYYIHGGVNKNPGLIDSNIPGMEKPEKYTYDPEHPLPSSFKDSEGRTIFADPAALENRDDVLVYRSEALTEKMEVTGCVKFMLYAGTTVTDTDFTCRLSDVDENGRSFPLLHGIVRARFRNGRSPEPIEPGKIYEYTIELGNISNVFLPGHRIRLDLSSSSYPAHNRNLNTGERTGHGTYSIKAEQTVFHDQDNPSHLILPVILSK